MPMMWLEGCAGWIFIVDANDVTEEIQVWGRVVYANGPTRCKGVCVVGAQRLRRSLHDVGQLSGIEYRYMRVATRIMYFGAVDGYRIFDRLLKVTNLRKGP